MPVQISKMSAWFDYLESKNAAPLLFHLIALTNPEEFLPLIEREIQARSFFLYCESRAAKSAEARRAGLRRSAGD